MVCRTVVLVCVAICALSPPLALGSGREEGGSLICEKLSAAHSSWLRKEAGRQDSAVLMGRLSAEFPASCWRGRQDHFLLTQDLEPVG